MNSEEAAKRKREQQRERIANMNVAFHRLKLRLPGDMLLNVASTKMNIINCAIQYIDQLTQFVIHQAMNPIVVDPPQPSTPSPDGSTSEVPSTPNEPASPK